jgi:hypothetical protein
VLSQSCLCFLKGQEPRHVPPQCPFCPHTTFAFMCDDISCPFMKLLFSLKVKCNNKYLHFIFNYILLSSKNTSSVYTQMPKKNSLFINSSIYIGTYITNRRGRVPDWESGFLVLPLISCKTFDKSFGAPLFIFFFLAVLEAECSNLHLLGGTLPLEQLCQS